MIKHTGVTQNTYSWYRVTHKGLYCKDDRKLIKYDDFKVKLKISLKFSFFKTYNLLFSQKKAEVNRENKGNRPYAFPLVVLEVSSFVDNPA